MSRRPDAKGPSDPSTDATQTSEYARSDVSAGDVMAGRYRLERLVGMGAMGQVFEAYDQHLETPVAAKLLRPDLAEDPTALERFRQELLVARKVSHPHVIRLHDMVRDGDHWLITMDYVQGETLEQRLARDGKLGVEESVDICRQIAEGLAAAHEVGVIHRDLKPGNVLIDESGRVYISDFGIARSVSQAGLTRQGVLVGTPDYLSPEQAAGDPVDGRSDLYALGIILCEMLTGKLPFTATTTQEAVSQRLSRSPTPLDAKRDDVPPWLVRVCHRLLRRNPRRRYQSAVEVVGDLRQAGRSTDHKVPLLAGAIIIVLAAIGAVAWFLRPGAPVTAAAPSRVAVLPATGAQSAEAAWAAAAYATDLLADLEAPQPIGTPRVRATLARLALAPGRVPDHAGTIGRELGQPQLLLPSFEDDGLSMVLLDPQEDYESDGRYVSRVQPGTQAVAETIRAYRSDLGAPPAADVTIAASWQDTVDFYTGLALLEQGNPKQALEPLQAMTGRDSDSWAGWWALSRAFEALGRWDDAQDAALKAGSKATGDGLYAELARARQATATGNYSSAQQTLETLVAAYPHDNTLKTLLAEFLGEGGEIEPAVRLLNEVTADDPEHVRAWFLLAKYSILAGNSRKALDDYLVKALVIQNRLENRQGQADVINAMGVAFERLGQSEQAAEHYQRAVQIRRAIGDSRGEASTLRNLAAIEAIRGNPDDAQSYLDRARELLIELDDQEGLAALYNDLGFLAEERGAYEEALEAYRNSLRLRRQLPNERALAESLSNVGYAFYQLGQFDNADAYWSQAGTIFRKVGDAYNEVHMAQQLALLDWVRGRWAQAIGKLEETLHTTEAQQMPEERAVTLGLQAQVHFSAGDFVQAMDAAAEAADLFAQRKDQRGILEMQILTGNILLALGDGAAARSAIESANLEGANQEQTAKLQDLEARIHMAAGDLPTARDEIGTAIEHARASGSASTRLAVDVTATRLSGQAEEWQAVLKRADELAHVPLQLESYRAAIERSLDRGASPPAEWFDTAWSIALERIPTRHDPWFTATGLRLCPIAGDDCDAWAQRHRETMDAALARVPGDYTEVFRREVGEHAEQSRQ